MSHWKRWRQEHVPSTIWSSSRDHASVRRPECSECSAYAIVWQRCKCKAWFARCGDHKPAEVAKMRAEHRCEVKR